MTHFRFAALALSATVLAGCISTEPVATQDYGFVVIVGEPDGAGGSVVSNPLAYFLRTSQIGISEDGATTDRCEVGQIPASSEPVPGLPYLDAGASVTVGTPDGPITLLRDAIPNQILYSAEGSFVHTPGGELSVTVPGADGGFPAMSVTGSAAPEFTFQEVPFSEDAASDVVLDWTPAPVAGRTTMNVSLRYAADGTTLNRQIFCSLVDDGSYTVDRILAEGWNNAQGGIRDALFERVQIELQSDVDTESTLVLFSTYLQSEPAPVAP